MTTRKEVTRTLALDRTNDAVYTATTNVVKAIMSLSQGVEKAAAIEYLDLVRNVGIELRALLSSVDTLASIFPPQAHKYVLSWTPMNQSIEINLRFHVLQRSGNGTQSTG